VPLGRVLERCSEAVRRLGLIEEGPDALENITPPIVEERRAGGSGHAVKARRLACRRIRDGLDEDVPRLSKAAADGGPVR
jgi:hypothetical protein